MRFVSWVGIVMLHDLDFGFGSVQYLHDDFNSIPITSVSRRSSGLVLTCGRTRVAARVDRQTDERHPTNIKKAITGYDRREPAGHGSPLGQGRSHGALGECN